MAGYRGYSITTVARLLRLLRDEGPCSRAKLARLSSMGQHTLEKYLDGLLVPLGMVEMRTRARRKKEYVITPLGIIVSVLLETLREFFDPGKHEFRKAIVSRVEEELRSRGFSVKNLLSSQCSLATPADLHVTSDGRGVFLYIATSGDEALVKAVMGLGLSALNGRGVVVVVATPEKPCMSLNNGGEERVHIVYYDPSNVEGAAKEIARSIEQFLREKRLVLAEPSVLNTRIHRI